jgi:hypothetical protein
MTYLPARKRWHLTFTYVSFLLLCLVSFAPAADLPSSSDLSADSVWRTLRERYPYHIQTVALGDPGKHGERVLIIAEPPPTLPRSGFREALEDVFGAALRDAKINQQRVGYDGWVEDIVATVQYPIGAQGDKQLRDDLAFLARRMYGTSYKFAPIHVPPTTAAPPLIGPPNLTVTAAELKSWLLDGQQRLVSLDFGTAHHLRELLMTGRPGVYLSERRGLMILLLPRDQVINAYRDDIRKFTLDTDAIVGAISIGDKRLALVGRERDTSLEAVPPLRSETILALAATKENELGQSYERQTLFAGKLLTGPDFAKDWAPIYLSQDLTNTEFGSLLNITDQMLKSWSESGGVDYINFNYKKPNSFPFKDGLLLTLGTSVVTYNWNTVGVGGIFAFEDARVFAITRTGSLPVSYFPEGENQTSEPAIKASAAEDKGYDYFSGLRDPYLGRVVQYSALYQIFRAFPVNAERDELSPANYRAATVVLLADAQKALRGMMQGTAKVDESYIKGRIELEARSTNERITPEERQLLATILNAKVSSDLKKAREIFLSFPSNSDLNISDRIATISVDRGALNTQLLERVAIKLKSAKNDAELDRTINSLSLDERTALTDIILLKSRDQLDQLKRTVKSTVNLNAERDRYVQAAAAIENGYIKTASIVLSWSDNLEGGHNLYSRTTAVETATNVPTGDVLVDVGSNGRKTLRINPADAPRSNELTRVYERHADEPNVTQLLRAELARGGTVREPRVALAVAQENTIGGRGLTRVNEGNLAVAEPGYRNQSVPAEVFGKLQATAEARGLDMVLSRDSEGFLVVSFQPKPPHAVRAPTESALIETVNGFAERTAASRLPSGQPPLRIGVAEGISEGELWGIVKTQEVRTTNGGGGRWKPPVERSIDGAPPQSGRPRGLFFSVDKDSSNTIGYTTRGTTGDPIVLRVTAKEANKAQDILRQNADWANAAIKPLDASPVTARPGTVQLAYEVTIPVKAGGHENSLILKVLGFFKRALSAEDGQKVEAAFNTIKTRLSNGSASADGIALLKEEILRNVKPEALEFHLKFSTDDLIIVERRTDIENVAS